MKSVIVISLAILFLSIVFVSENTKMGSDVFAQTQARDAVLLICSPDPIVSPPPAPRKIIVTASSLSGNARAVTPGNDCAQALADMLRADFKIVNVQSMFTTAGVLYTLAK